MTDAPELAGAGLEVYEDGLAPWTSQDEANGWALAWLTHGIGLELQAPFEFMALGWDAAMDPDVAPVWFLPHLAMWAGVRLIPNGLTEEQQRARVRSTDGMRRGTPDAIVGAARQFLTDPVNGSVILLERTDPDNPGDEAYHYTVVTYTDETPDSALVLAALMEQKPVGHILHYVVASGYLIALFEDDYDGQTISDAEGDFATIYDLETHTP
jgi:hypothetical protein